MNEQRVYVCTHCHKGTKEVREVCDCTSPPYRCAPMRLAEALTASARFEDMEDHDYTGHTGQLHRCDEQCDWPMYSFDRPAAMFWNGFANALRLRGLSDDEIKAQLQSKGTRWLLDARDGEVEQLGLKMGAEYVLLDLDE